jgi:AraC-like DNA-binding protein
MTETSTAPPRGTVLAEEGDQHFDLRRHEPSEDLAFFVERHWIVEWDADGGPPDPCETSTYPCVNVVFEPSGPSAYGVNTRLLSADLPAAGRCVVTQFRAAGFQPFSRTHMSDLTGRVVPLGEIFQMPDPVPDVLGAADDRAAVGMVEAVLCAQTPARDPNVDLVNRVIAEMVDGHLTTVEAVAARFDMTPRKLQRLFARYVGVSPTAYLREPS